MFINIYNGPGAVRVDVLFKSMVSALSRLSGMYPQLRNATVRTIEPGEVKEGAWMHKSSLFVLPGGFDLPYVRDLNGPGVENIRKFVVNGGSFLGLCAGAYFASSFVDFERGSSLEVIGSRELCFFSGSAKGSVYPGFSYEGTITSRMVPLMLHSCRSSYFLKTVSHSWAYFNGGCMFILEKANDFDVLATYSDFPGAKAIILQKVGSGQALLCGVHPEMDIAFLDQGEYASSQWEAMSLHSECQRSLFNSIILTLLA